MWDSDARRSAELLVSQYEPLIVAQLILSRVAESNHHYLLRKALYGDREFNTPSPLMRALVRWCRERNVAAIINYNYDDILESALKQCGVPLSPVWSPSVVPQSHSIPIYYPHGYLKQGGGPLTRIVLSESDYHSYSTIPYSWGTLLQTRSFGISSCVFIGLSMTDPLIRRLLWVAKQAGGTKVHYAFLPSQAAQDENASMIEALVDAQLADLNVRTIRYPVGSTGERHARLVSLIEEVLEATRDIRILWN